ncbi:ABC transporter ATP-binding protein [Methylophilus aquaticus]|uniref:ABC transporter ATP-binding protein n=1 Tax=Methylophilus aquaticus TaxID=1971610 RepID=A0ABT9JQG0_9PROT|nr:ABC transporter ATP-binding protein [Methylophilus aquaticus]MDP8566365.1 ABC transporter ATP-binding protein [Methylophilus aquaticus]
MIKISQLNIRFGDFKAVDGLSLDIPQGELFGFLGPNGAGKTTTIRALNGALTPTSGSIEVLGYAMPKELQKVKPFIGYVPDTENHYEDMTGHENLALYARLYGVPFSEIDRWLSVLQLSEAAHVKVRTYSKGMKKKLLIARELLHAPKLVFFDEPTANLDAHSIQLVRRLMQDLAAQGTTVFLTTHDMEEVEQICDRVAIIAKGKLLDCDTPTAFITRHAERFCDVQYDRDGVMVRHSYHLDDPAQRAALAHIIQTEHCLRVHSREFKFEDVFKKLTGEAYQ